MWAQVLQLGSERAHEARFKANIKSMQVALGCRMQDRAMRDGDIQLFNRSQMLLHGSLIRSEYGKDHSEYSKVYALFPVGVYCDKGVANRWHRGAVYRVEAEMDTGHTEESEQLATQFVQQHLNGSGHQLRLESLDEMHEMDDLDDSRYRYVGVRNLTRSRYILLTTADQVANAALEL